MIYTTKKWKQAGMDWIVFASYPYVKAITPNVTYNVTYLELRPLGR